MLAVICISSVAVCIWLIQVLHEAEHGYDHHKINNQLDSYRATDDELVNWDQHTKGGRRG